MRRYGPPRIQLLHLERAPLHEVEERRARRLVAAQHVRPGGIVDRALIIGLPDHGLERRRRAMNLQALCEESLQHVDRGVRVALTMGHAEGERPVRLGPSSVSARHEIPIEQEIATEPGGRLEHGPGGDPLIVDDVAQTPFAAPPRIREVHREAVLVQPAPRSYAVEQLLFGDRDGRGNIRAGGLGEQADDVVVSDGQGAFLPVNAVHLAVQYTWLPGSLQIRHDRPAHELRLLPEQRRNRLGGSGYGGTKIRGPVRPIWCWSR